MSTRRQLALYPTGGAVAHELVASIEGVSVVSTAAGAPTIDRPLAGSVVNVSAVTATARNLGPFILHQFSHHLGNGTSPFVVMDVAPPTDVYFLALVSWADVAVTCTPPSGWTAGGATSVTGVRSGAWYGRSDGSTTLYTFTLSADTDFLVRWMSVGGASPENPVSAGAATVTGASLPTTQIVNGATWPQEGWSGFGFTQGVAATYTLDAAADALLNVNSAVSGCLLAETAARRGILDGTIYTTSSSSSNQAVSHTFTWLSRRRWLLDRTERGPDIYQSRVVTVHPSWGAQGVVIRLLVEVYSLTGAATVSAVLEQEHAAQLDTGLYSDTGSVAPLTEVGGGEVRARVVGYKARCRLIVTGDPGDLALCQVTLEAVREDWA